MRHAHTGSAYVERFANVVKRQLVQATSPLRRFLQKARKDVDISTLLCYNTNVDISTTCI